ncbi:hypothetical protein [Bacteroides ilei]|uniref:hypothetical protein n=1 Tax=Bacteroides ilei TaxID=1907658 RepID=UPI0009320036|nr:hypothetical protein [Bacteroides ilei]
MKKLGLTLVVALVFSASVFASDGEGKTTKWNGSINKEKLTKYLKLNATQNDEVADICDYFEEQMKIANSSKKDNNEKVRTAVYGNLKLMKKALNDEQYASYVRLMALTLHNKGIEVK